MSIESIQAVMSRVATIRGLVPATSPASRFQASLAQAIAEDAAAGRDGSPAPVRTDVGLAGASMSTGPGMAHAAPSAGLDASWSDRLPPQARQWVEPIEMAARKAGLDPRLLAAVVWTESGFDPDAVSHVGAIGLAQLMPGTAEALGVDPTDPVENLEGGARFLASMIRRFGSAELGLAAYNAGPTRVATAGGIPNIPETLAYVPKVLDRYQQLGGQT